MAVDTTSDTRSDLGSDTGSGVIGGVCDEGALVAVNGRLSVLAGQLNAVNAALVDETVGLLATGGWQQAGRRTPSAFLQWRLGLSKARADEVVRVAGRRDEFPVLMGGVRAW